MYTEQEIRNIYVECKKAEAVPGWRTALSIAVRHNHTECIRRLKALDAFLEQYAGGYTNVVYTFHPGCVNCAFTFAAVSLKGKTKPSEARATHFQDMVFTRHELIAAGYDPNVFADSLDWHFQNGVP